MGINERQDLQNVRVVECMRWGSNNRDLRRFPRVAPNDQGDAPVRAVVSEKAVSYDFVLHGD